MKSTMKLTAISLQNYRARQGLCVEGRYRFDPQGFVVASYVEQLMRGPDA